MSQLTPKPLKIDGSTFRIGIVAGRFNEIYVDGLLDGALEALKAGGVQEASIRVERVPGSNELPVASKWMAESGSFDAVIALGAIIRGGTRHFEMVADGSNLGLHQVALETGVPIINGVIVGDTEAEVKERCVGSIPKGRDFGQCALEMAQLKRKYESGRE